jgi:E3 ubiquitin-protein ligase RNF115/126
MSEVSHAGAPPASEQCINRLARTKIASAAEAEALGGTCCGISHEPFETGDVVVSLACKHSYLEDNIVTWLRAHNTCPVCRFQVVESSTAPTAATAVSTQD